MDNVKTNLVDLSSGIFATGAQGSTISWTSSGTALTNTGVVTRLDATGSNSKYAGVRLTATLTNGGITDTKEFYVKVLNKDFAAVGQEEANNTFTITGDGYALTDFSAAADSIAFKNGNQPTITVNGITYSITYDSGTGIATVTSTAGTAEADAVATCETINIKKAGKTLARELYIPAINSGTNYKDVTVTVGVTFRNNLTWDVALNNGEMVANVGGRTVRFKFTDNDGSVRDVLNIYNLDETVKKVYTTGFATNVGGSPVIGDGAGWNVGKNTGSQPTIRITLKDENMNTIIQSGEWKLINSSNGGNLK